MIINTMSSVPCCLHYHYHHRYQYHQQGTLLFARLVFSDLPLPWGPTERNLTSQDDTADNEDRASRC